MKVNLFQHLFVLLVKVIPLFIFTNGTVKVGNDARVFELAVAVVPEPVLVQPENGIFFGDTGNFSGSQLNSLTLGRFSDAVN